jgi:hypothetical protein
VALIDILNQGLRGCFFLLPPQSAHGNPAVAGFSRRFLGLRVVARIGIGIDSGTVINTLPGASRAIAQKVMH